jgi:hypothetical protein
LCAIEAAGNPRYFSRLAFPHVFPDFLNSCFWG